MMNLVEWLKWRVAPKEMEELERWRIQWEEHRRWFAEFPIAAVTLDRLKAKADGEPVTSIHTVRDSCRSADVEQVRQITLHRDHILRVNDKLRAELRHIKDHIQGDCL